MKRIALQMYTVRNFGANLDERLAMVRNAGFSYVEMSPGENVDRDIELLDKHGVTPISSGIELESWKDQKKVEDNFAFLDHFAARGSMHGFFESKVREDWITAAATLELMAQEFERRGFVLEYHNHDHEYRLNFDGQNALDVIFENAPSLKYEMDIGWVTAGGADPVAMMERYARQLSAIHVKDLPATYVRGSEEIMPDLGEGETPIPAAVEKALELGVTDFIVENDTPADIPQFCDRSYRYLSELLA